MQNFKKINTLLPPDKIKRPKISTSKYELTLAEFPLFLLSKGGKFNPRQIESINYEDLIVGKNREEVKRQWKVYPDGKLGFGTASTFSTLFELFQIWKDQSFNSPYIQFGSIYNLLKRTGKETGNKQYKQIIRDLNCLVGMRIEAKNAFWDNERKAYVDITFHLFDTLYLYKDKPTGQAVLPFSTIEASEVLYGSIQKNSLLIVGFDSKFFHRLSPLEKRLAIYLSKVFRSQIIHKRDLILFAHQMPLYVEQPKLIRQRLKTACEGLIKKGFGLLDSFDFRKSNRKHFIVLRRRGDLTLPFKATENNPINPLQTKNPHEVELLIEDILQVCQDSTSYGFYKKVARLVSNQDIYRALSEVKQIRDTGTIKKSKGAIFTNLIKKYAQEQGIEL